LAPATPVFPIAIPMEPASRMYGLPKLWRASYSNEPSVVLLPSNRYLMPVNLVMMCRVRFRMIRRLVPVGKSDARGGSFSRTPVD